MALMHDPELLILDEPTVGVDPLLRQSIWNHLVQITKDGNKTVIITTHYIEEARQAHAVSVICVVTLSLKALVPDRLDAKRQIISRRISWRVALYVRLSVLRRSFFETIAETRAGWGCPTRGQH